MTNPNSGPCGDCDEQVCIIDDETGALVDYGCMAFFHVNKRVIRHRVDYSGYCKAYTKKEVGNESPPTHNGD